MDVTTTSARQGKFEARFYHKIFEDEIGRVKGHFGPLNTIAVHPQGLGYASGGEDGYVRMHTFDKAYFDFKYEVERESATISESFANLMKRLRMDDPVDARCAGATNDKCIN
jgi:translation initiation factor 3 subunit I